MGKENKNEVLKFQEPALQRKYGHENEMYNVGVNLKEGERLKMRELRVDWEKMRDKTKCAKG